MCSPPAYIQFNIVLLLQEETPDFCGSLGPTASVTPRGQTKGRCTTAVLLLLHLLHLKGKPLVFDATRTAVLRRSSGRDACGT